VQAARFELACVAGYEGLLLQVALGVAADAPFEVGVGAGRVRG